MYVACVSVCEVAGRVLHIYIRVVTTVQNGDKC